MSGSQLASVFQIGPRISAQILGSPYAQYRPSGAYYPTNFGNLIATIPAWITADASGMGKRPFTYAKPTSYAMVDPAVTQVGDYLIGPLGTFFVASQDVPMPIQIVSCNQTITVSRPGDPPTGPGYYGGAAPGVLEPILSEWPASVLQGTKGEVGEVKLPGDTRLAWVAVLMPSVGGVEIMPGDWITTGEASPMTYTISSRELTPLGWRLSASTAVG